MKRLYLLFLLLSLMSTAAFAQRVALRTDLLLWGTTTPNAGVETSISRHFTVALNGAYNAWKFGNDMKLNLYFVQPELRYWPCRKFEGHFLGVCMQTKTGNVIINTLMPPKSHTISR